MYRSYQNERGTWNVERYSLTCNQVETVRFGLTKEQAQRVVYQLNYFAERGI